MEFFLPSVVILLLAAAVVFFVFPRFGAPTLAILSVVLLVFGIHQHMGAFGSEYRLSTWQFDILGYAPYIMVGGVLVVIALFLLNLTPFGKAPANTTAPSMPEMPTVAEMPPANTATNALTAGVNTALKGAANAAAAIGIGNAAKTNNKGVAAPAINAAAQVANTAAAAVNKTVTGITNAITGAANAITGNTKANANRTANQGLAAALGLGGNTKPANNRGTRIPGLNFPLSQA